MGILDVAPSQDRAASNRNRLPEIDLERTRRNLALVQTVYAHDHGLHRSM